MEKSKHLFLWSVFYTLQFWDMMYSKAIKHENKTMLTNSFSFYWRVILTMVWKTYASDMSYIIQAILQIMQIIQRYFYYFLFFAISPELVKNHLVSPNILLFPRYTRTLIYEKEDYYLQSKIYFICEKKKYLLLDQSFPWEIILKNVKVVVFLN